MIKSKHNFIFDVDSKDFRVLADALKKIDISRIKGMASVFVDDFKFKQFSEYLDQSMKSKERLSKQSEYSLYFNSASFEQYMHFAYILESIRITTFKVFYSIDNATPEELEKFELYIGSYISNYSKDALYAANQVIAMGLNRDDETVESLRLLIAAADAAGIPSMSGKFWLSCTRDRFSQILTSLQTIGAISEVSIIFREGDEN